MKIILIALIAYLLGSFCASIPLSRRCCGGDVRLYGSGNAGATNMARVYGLKAGLATLLLDMLKTVAAMLLGEYFMGGAGKAVAGAFCIIGHCFPLYFGFRGGKGILTSIGIIAVINPFVFLGLLIIGLPLIFLTKIVSVGSLAGAVCYPFLTLLVDFWQGGVSWLDFSFSLVIALLVIWMHRSNIKRLLNGTENRFGSKKTSSEEKK